MPGDWRRSRRAPPQLERARAPKAGGEVALQRPGAALQLGEARGEATSPGAEPVEAAPQAPGGARQAPSTFFQPLAAGDEAVEAAVDAAGDAAQPPHFVSGRGDRPGQGPRLPGPAAKRGVASGFAGERRGQCPRPGEAVAADLGQERAQPELQGEAADGGLPLRVVELPGPFGEAAEGAGGALAPGRGALEPGGDQAGALLGAAGALAEQAAAESGLAQTGAQPRDRVRGAVQARSEAGELPGAVGPGCGEALSQPPQRRGPVGQRRRADHGPDPRLGGDPPLPAVKQRQPPLGGDRPGFCRRDEDEGRLPAGADGGVDRFGALARRVGGR